MSNLNNGFLNFNAPINCLSYGICAYNFLKEFYNLNINIRLFEIGNIECDPLYDQQLIQHSINQSQMIVGKDPCLKLFHQFTLHERIGTGLYCAYTIFELDGFTLKEKFCLECPDILFVPTTWAKDVVLRHTNRDSNTTHVVNLGIDTNIFFPHNNSFLKDNEDQYVFLVLGKAEIRKCHDIISGCFSKAFNYNDNVKLCLMTNNIFLNADEKQQWDKIWFGTKLKDKIKFIQPCRSHQDIAHVINGCSCFIGISRGEGWNMPLMEAMACDKPVITTNCTAMTEYCNDENAFLIPFQNQESAHDNKWFFGQGDWMGFDYDEEESLIEYMRTCYKNKVGHNPQGIETAKQYSWNKSAHQLIQHIKNNG